MNPFRKFGTSDSKDTVVRYTQYTYYITLSRITGVGPVVMVAIPDTAEVVP